MTSTTNQTGSGNPTQPPRPSRPGQRALRKGRVSLPGQAYVLTTVTHQRRALFADLYLGRKVVAAMRRVQEQGWARTLAFVVMPDHLHWLFVLGDTTLGKVAQAVKGGSARAMSGRVTAPVWQRGYFDHAVRGDEDLRVMARYVVANPLRAGLVERRRNMPYGMRCGWTIPRRLRCCRSGFSRERHRPVPEHWTPLSTRPHHKHAPRRSGFSREQRRSIPERWTSFHAWNRG